MTGGPHDAVPPVEDLHKHGAVRGRQLPKGVGDQLPVQDLLQSCVVAALLGGLGVHGGRP